MTNVQLLLQEKWNDIPGYEGFYQASNLGRIRSLDRIVNYGKYKRKRKGIVLKPFYNRSGYLLVYLCDRCYSVHGLILKTFVGAKPNGWYGCMHLNDKKDDNRLENLKWGTYSENAKSAIDNKLYTPGRTGQHGKNNPQSKPVIQKDLNGNVIQVFDSAVDAAKYINSRQSSISAACTRESNRRQHRGYIWEYK